MEDHLYKYVNLYAIQMPYFCRCIALMWSDRNNRTFLCIREEWYVELRDQKYVKEVYLTHYVLSGQCYKCPNSRPLYILGGQKVH